MTRESKLTNSSLFVFCVSLWNVNVTSTKRGVVKGGYGETTQKSCLWVNPKKFTKVGVDWVRNEKEGSGVQTGDIGTLTSMFYLEPLLE